MEKNDRIRIELTNEQRHQLKDASGKDIDVIEFKAEELEQRIAPAEFLRYDMNACYVTSVQLS